MKPDGGPAFGSLVIEGGRVDHSGGMTLRDYFAAASAMGQRMIDRPISSVDVAGLAYIDADAMLKEREK